MNLFQDNSCWDFVVDQQIASWACEHPEDWQLGGKCNTYLWGGGRRGQLCEGGSGVSTPALASSFSKAQQVGH